MFTSVCETRAARKHLVIARKVRALKQSVKSPTHAESNPHHVALSQRARAVPDLLKGGARDPASHLEAPAPFPSNHGSQRGLTAKTPRRQKRKKRLGVSRLTRCVSQGSPVRIE